MNSCYIKALCLSNKIQTVLPLIVSGVTIALVYDVRMLSMGNQLQGSII